MGISTTGAAIGGVGVAKTLSASERRRRRGIKEKDERDIVIRAIFLGDRNKEYEKKVALGSRFGLYTQKSEKKTRKESGRCETLKMKMLIFYPSMNGSIGTT